MTGPGDDIIDDIGKGFTDDSLKKKYQLNADQIKAFRTLHYGLTNNKLSSDQIGDYFPDLNDYFGKKAAQPALPALPAPPSQPTPKPALPKEDYSKPVRQPNPTESVRFGDQRTREAGPAFTDEQRHEQFLREKYDPYVKEAFKTFGQEKDKYIVGKRPALDEHPEMPTSMFQHLNMDEVDNYLKAQIPNTDDRYYVRNQIKNTFQAQKDQYHIDQLAEQKVKELPAVQKAEEAVRNQLGTKVINTPKDQYMGMVMQEAVKMDPGIKDQVQQVYGEATKEQETAKNETIRNVMNNTFGDVSLPTNIPFHDQITGTAKALQGFFKFSGQVGQMASDLLHLIPAKAAQEASSNVRNASEGFIEKNAFPEKDVTAPEFLTGELEPMLLQGAAMGKAAKLLGAPLFEAINGAKAAGQMGKFAEGMLGGMATAPANAYMISQDYYHNLTRNGENPAIAKSKAEDLFSKNLITDLAITPLQIGYLNVPMKGLDKLIVQPGLSASLAGIQSELQGYYQEQGEKPTTKLLQYVLSPEGLKTGLTGAAMGLIQHAVIGKMNDWQTSRATQSAFDFLKAHNTEGTPELPNNNVIALQMLRAIEMKDVPGRVKELKNFINESVENGTYTADEAKRIGSVIDDVAAVRSQIPKIGTPEQRVAILNEALQQRSLQQALQEPSLFLKDYIAPMQSESSARIKRILDNQEPLYFVNGFETSKEQLLQAVKDNPVLLNKNAGIKIVNDPETAQEIINLKNNQHETSTGERATLRATEGQTEPQTGDTEPGSSSSSHRPQEIREEEIPGVGREGQEINSPQNDNDAISQHQAEKLPLSNPPGDGAAVGGGNEGQGPVHQETAPARPQKIITTPEELKEVIPQDQIAAQTIVQRTNLPPEQIKEQLLQAGYDEKSASKVLSNSYTSPEQHEAYTQNMGMRPSVTTGRIPVDPIVGGQAKNKSEIIADFSKALKQKVFYLSPGKSNAAGSYSPTSAGIKIRYTGDLDTTAHEVGHALDDRYGIYPAVVGNKSLLDELNEFASHGGSEPPANHPDPVKYKLQEGFAEWLRGYIVNPKAAIEQAPNLYKLYQDKTSPVWKKAIESFSNDFRSWEGSTAVDQIKSQVQFDQKHPNVLTKLFKKEDSDGNFSVNMLDKLQANFVNQLHVFEKAYKYAKGIQGISDVLPADDPVILSRVLAGIDAKYNSIIEHGMIDGEMRVLKDANGNVKNLNWLLEPYDNTDVSTIRKDMEDTVAYMIAERTAEMALRFEREGGLTGIGGEQDTDAVTAIKALNEFKTGDANRLKRIQEGAARYREFADDMLKYMVDKGRMSKEQYEAIKKDNQYYVSLQRINEAAPGQELEAFTGAGGNLGSKGEPIQKLKGSSKAIENPYVPLLDTLYKVIRESDRNEVLRAFRDMIYQPREMNAGEPERFSDIGQIAKEGDKNTVPIFIDGKAEHWRFNEDVYKVFKGLDHDAYRLPWFLRTYANVLRFTTTQFPTFAVRNWVRDLQDRIIKSNEGSEFAELVGPHEDWTKVARAGGLNAGYYYKSKDAYYGLMKEAMSDMAKNKKFILADPTRLKELWHKYENVLYASETSNRVAEYRAGFNNAKQKGMDDYNAMLYGASKARDLIDFAIAGHHMRIINQIVPFSNASVQGIRSSVLRAKENPIGFLGRTFVYSVIPKIALWLYNHRDEESGNQYEDLPYYQRDMFWNTKVGPNTWLSIPKPYELSITAAGFDRLMSKTFLNKENAFDGYAGDVAKSLLPFDESNFGGSFQPIIEGITNYDFFRDKYIIPPDENARDLSLRNTSTASRLGQVIQQAAGIDARKVDHFIGQQFSYVGRTAMKLSDIGRDKDQFDLTDTGLMKRSPSINAPAVQELMKFADTWNLGKSSEYRDFKHLIREYFSMKTDEEKEQKGKELIAYAKDLLQYWKDEKMDEQAKEKAEERAAQLNQ